MFTNKPPYRRISFPHGVVKIDRDLLRELHRLGLRVLADDVRPYPYLVRSMAPAGPTNVYVDELHHWIWQHLVANGERRPLRDGDVIHHRDHDKLNNTRDNLGVGTRKQHLYVHEKAKQKFAPRRKLKPSGFHRPRSSGPVRVMTSTEAEREVRVTARSDGNGAADRMRAFQAALRDRLEESRERVHGRGTWVKPAMAKKGWTDPETFRLGIRRPGHRLSLAEAAFVGVMVVNAVDRDAVAADLGVGRDLVDLMMKRPLVHEAIAHWLRTQGLPYQLLPRRPRRRRGKGRGPHAP